jgi:carboxymethylenebutenolidase
MADEHEGETPSATEAARAPDVPVTTKTVSYTTTPDGTPVSGYLAAPANPDSVLSAHGMDPATDSLPGIVVIHEWWGLNDNIRTATRRLAGQGYRALAVDVYRGDTANSSDSARALMQRAMQQQDQLMANLQDAHDYLRTEAGAPRVAVMGWCFGGGRTFDAVAAAPAQYDAAVAYYGNPQSMTTDVLRNTTTPILAHFGKKDQAVSVEAARNFQTRFQDTGVEGRVYFYDAGHAFANPSGESYVPDAAEQAWSRTTDFLRQHLYPS